MIGSNSRIDLENIEDAIECLNQTFNYKLFSYSQYNMRFCIVVMKNNVSSICRFSVMVASSLSSCNILQNWCFLIELKELTIKYTFSIPPNGQKNFFRRVTVQVSRRLKSIVLKSIHILIQNPSLVSNLFKKGFLSLEKQIARRNAVHKVFVAVKPKFYIDRHIPSWSGDYVVWGMLMASIISHNISWIFSMALIRSVSVAAGRPLRPSFFEL